MEDDIQLLTDAAQTPQQEPQLEQAEPKRRRYIVTGVFALAMIGLVAFSWRVFSFYRAIDRGEVVPVLAYSSDDFTRAGAAVARLAQGEEVTDTTSVDDPSLGSSTAKVTIVEFADFGCPYSKEVSYIVRAIAQQFPDQVHVIYRDFPLTDVHPGADLAAQAGECAQEQDMFWEFHDKIYADDDDLTQENMLRTASAVGLDEEEFATCLLSGRFEDEVNEDLRAGAAAGVVGTPTFFFNGVKIEGSIPFAIFNEIVHALLED